MSAHSILIDVLLGSAVVACWLGVIGMLRMPHPTQALQYLQLPGVGMFAATIAIFLKTGPTSTAFKTLLIAIVLMGINSVVTHATARAFRVRHLGHWQPLDGDPIEFVPSSHHPEKQP